MYWYGYATVGTLDLTVLGDKRFPSLKALHKFTETLFKMFEYVMIVIVSGKCQKHYCWASVDIDIASLKWTVGPQKKN